MKTDNSILVPLSKDMNVVAEFDKKIFPTRVDMAREKFSLADLSILGEYETQDSCINVFSGKAIENHERQPNFLTLHQPIPSALQSYYLSMIHPKFYL